MRDTTESAIYMLVYTHTRFSTVKRAREYIEQQTILSNSRQTSKTDSRTAVRIQTHALTVEVKILYFLYVCFDRILFGLTDNAGIHKLKLH